MKERERYGRKKPRAFLPFREKQKLFVVIALRNNKFGFVAVKQLAVLLYLRSFSNFMEHHERIQHRSVCAFIHSSAADV